MSATPSYSAVLIGADSLLIECGEQLRRAGHAIRAILTTEPRVRQWAEGADIPVIAPTGDYAAQVAALPAFDWLFSIANLQVVPAAVLALPGKAAVNFHDGPLPHYAGLYAPAWALMDGRATHGITWHRMLPEVDQGELLLQRTFAVEPGDTSLTLNLKCYQAAVESFGELVDGLAHGTLTPVAHTLDRATYHGRVDRPAGRGTLRWTHTAAQLEALASALDFGGYPNPLGLPKLLLPDGSVVLAPAIARATGPSSAAPGTVLAADAEGITVAVADGAVRLTRLRTVDGAPLSITDLAGRHELLPGARLPEPDAATIARVDAANARLVKSEPHWVRRLGALAPLALPLPLTHGDDAATHAAGTVSHEVALPALADVDQALALAAAWLARLTGNGSFDLLLRDDATRAAAAGVEGWFAAQLPVRVEVAADATAADATAAVRAALAAARAKGTYARSTLARYPQLKDLARDEQGLALPVALVAGDDATLAGRTLTLNVSADARTLTLRADGARLSAAELERLGAALETFVGAAAAKPDAAVATLPLVPRELARRLGEWNATATDVAPACVHELVQAQARRTPDAIAIRHADVALTYAQLEARAERLASHLRELGVGPDVLVGLCMHRSPELVIGALAIQRAGGAYVPLDPTYPADRLAFMLADSEAPLLLTQERLLEQIPPGFKGAVVCIDRVEQLDDELARTVPAIEPLARPEHLAYVIYTSGSTGKPKGVMIEHRTVVNFFAGMDARLAGTTSAEGTPGTWLAVTSLSFDISVLELFYTLSRGYTVVVAGDEAKAKARRPMQFSLFYFSADERENRTDKYRLLIEGAKFADERGFVAVWTPERHFHAFGGLYPNPAVTSAALATVTSRVQLRAGSIVTPLHHPLRVAEEWSVVDNLSNGRAAISIAPGWQPNDFVLRPEVFGKQKQVMIEELAMLRKLWRGEAVSFTAPTGKPVDIRVQPRPIQPELPVWLTTAGTTESYRVAGEQGLKVLTHLLGQTVEELAEKIVVYRDAWRAAGHPGDGHVSLMLHTFVGDDDGAVKELVRKPMTDYLRTSLNLVKQYAWSFPAFKKKADGSAAGMDVDLESLSPDEMESLLEYSFERYYETSALFGTPETCMRMVELLRAIEVDEIAALIDFGVDSELVLSHLEHLDTVRAASQSAEVAGNGEDWSPAALIARHGVTHLQCTPSLAVMLLADDRAKAAMGGLTAMLVGGEACSASMAAQLRAAVGGRVLNMYGPTETTIWSTVHEIGDEPKAVPIGRPIANTQLYVVDALMQPVPAGVPGELLIGGAGMARGYHARPELTAERFVTLDAAPAEWARVYRTGDLARLRDDGVVEFLGRIDHQVKIRGYRIELGEIEALLQQEPAVREAVVIAREDVPGDKRLVAYVVPKDAASAPTAEALRERLKRDLPDFMVPSNVVLLADLPRTPNLKVDRKALPAPHAAPSLAAPTVSAAAPGSTPAATVAAPAAGAASGPTAKELEGEIASMWSELLRVPVVGLKDNFFDLGGHSLLAVQVHARLKKITGRDFPITDLFRFPTVSALAAHLGAAPAGANGQAAMPAAPAGAAAATAPTSAAARGEARRAALLGRRNR